MELVKSEYIRNYLSGPLSNHAGFTCFQSTIHGIHNKMQQNVTDTFS